MKDIKVENITRKFGSHIVLNNLNFTLSIGKMTAICGPSGCGKTTLLNIIGLLEKPDVGSVYYDGKAVKANSRAALKYLRYTIGFLFQNYGLSDNDTVMWNMMSAMEYCKGNKEEKRQQILAALDKVSLKGIENQKVSQLSGGEQQRVALARLMVKPCELLLADEPTGNLDKENRDIVFSILREMNREGKTILMVTHDYQLAQSCDEVLHLDKD